MKFKIANLEFEMFTEPFLTLNSELGSQWVDAIFEDTKLARNPPDQFPVVRLGHASGRLSGRSFAPPEKRLRSG
jgi:hypothetical protein